MLLKILMQCHNILWHSNVATKTSSTLVQDSALQVLTVEFNLITKNYWNGPRFTGV